MDRETLANIVYSGKVRFIPVRRCSLCDEYIGYKFVKMCDGSIIPVFSSGRGCCGVNNGQFYDRGIITNYIFDTKTIVIVARNK